MSPSTTGGPAAGTLARDQTQLVALEQQLSTEQSQAAVLSQRYDTVTTKLAKLQATTSTDSRKVAVTTEHLRRERKLLATVAVRSYVEGAGAGSTTSLFSSPQVVQTRTLYERNALGDLRAVAARYAATRHRLTIELEATETARNKAQAAQAQVLALTQQNRTATARIENSLSSAQSNLAQAAMAALALNDAVVSSGTPGTKTANAATLPSTPTVSTPKASAALAAAITQIGDPYVWGGETPKSPGSAGAFDCSGLTQWAWSQAGVSIPRTSQAQWASLPHVPLTKIQPGDLLFYYNLDGTHTVDHVVMYVGAGPYGAQTIVAAPYTGAFVGFEPFFGTGFVGAARP